MLELTGVSKTFGRAEVLQPTDLTIPPGRTTVLLGPSGCGKSTLLRLLMGLLRPDAGTVRINGTELTPGNALAVRRRIGYVIQEGGLFPHLTAQENVALMARYLGWNPEAIEIGAGVAPLPREWRLPDAPPEPAPER